MSTNLDADSDLVKQPPNSIQISEVLLESGSQRVGSVAFVATTPQRACDLVISLSQKRQGIHVHLANAYTVALADKDAEYQAVLATPAINFPDGKPVGWASKIRGDSPQLEQVRGPQLFLDVFDQGRASRVKHFLLGSTPGVLSALESKLTARFPGIEIVGVESPPFRSLTAQETSEQDARIAASGAQIVWIGLGTPKQDLEARRIVAGLPVVAIAIGAAFDFAAGTLRPAPDWMRRAGLEWLYRLMKEPRRLWRRYLFGNARFVKAAFASRGLGGL